VRSVALKKATPGGGRTCCCKRAVSLKLLAQDAPKEDLEPGQKIHVKNVTVGEFNGNKTLHSTQQTEIEVCSHFYII